LRPQSPPTSAPRARGRPARPESEQLVAALEAATWLLLNSGYAATTLEAVAKRAGMAKKTIYRFAANREDLVGQVVRKWTDAFEPVMAQEVGASADVLPALSRVLDVIAARALSSDAVGMFRLLTADFPARDALLPVYQKNGIERGTTMLGDWLGRLGERGLIRVRQPHATAGLLLSMVIAEPLRQMALGLIPPLPESSVSERIQVALAIFSGRQTDDGPGFALNGG
jgi:TetR/AcrR family transcriptional regulator, mexJK operon transcriptional repressor